VVIEATSSDASEKITILQIEQTRRIVLDKFKLVYASSNIENKFQLVN
jgi:hypothetical protein